MEAKETTILVVDDEPDLLDNICLSLETQDYRVLIARDGREALEILKTQPVNLILADIAMPVMNGYQLYEQIRKEPQWAFIPFIFLTARTMDSDVNYGKELGVDDYLSKPIRATDLLAAVRGKLRRVQEIKAAVSQFAEQHISQEQSLNLGVLKIDAEQHRVWVQDEEVKVSAREFILLDYLARHADKIVSPQELIKITHDLETDYIEAGSLLRPLILSLRRKLGSPVGEMGLIENVRGVGYRLVVSDR
jgi:DNA-binding response OmpR family regulator